MAISKSQQISAFAMVLALGVGYLVYSGTGISLIGVDGVKQRREHVAAIKDTIARLEAATDSAKKELAKGSVEDLRRRLEGYRGSLDLMRRLVPERNEVPNLLDDISTRAKIRGVNLSSVTPLAPEAGPSPFETYKYNLSVLGHYDQIGEFLSDVASLQRIIVPLDVTIAPANQQAAKALGDSTGAMLEAKLQIRTYVKSAQPEVDASGT
jgi:type IV pilus assembly protein PilO